MSNPEQVIQPADYHSFLVRLWRETEQDQWRASLRSIQTNEERHFAHLEQLFLFLYMQTIDRTEQTFAHQPKV
ncbi:MAG: hypothetical protein R2867_36920 [Caldilineaceae bacterium]